MIDCLHITVQLTRAVNTEAISGVSHDFSSVILPVKLTEFATHSSGAVFLPMFVTLVMKTLVRKVLRPLHFTFSTTESFRAFHLLSSFTFPDVSPVAPPPINDVLTDSQVLLPVVGYQIIAQSLAPVGLLHSPDTELGFLLY